jgi:hypothetical protein
VKGNVEKFGTGWFTGTPPPRPESPVDICGTIKDIFAITASAVTILVFASQVK